MKERFKTLIKLSTNLSDTKSLVENSIGKDIDDESFDVFMDEVVDIMYDEFSDEFDEDELDELLVFYERSVVSKWRMFYLSFAPIMQNRMEKWIAKYLTDGKNRFM